jgi:sulfite exporter TauE/SafE
MLGSITPLGERSRNARWATTVVWYAVGSTVAGAGLGWLLGWAGSLGLSGLTVQARLAFLAVLIAVGVVLDLRVLGTRLPTIRRQVSEDWLRQYRGWVYGVGFGVQLGLGVVTVVSISAVYVTFAAALLSGSSAAGAVIGGAFGLARASTVLSVGRVGSPGQLVSVDARLRMWDRTARRAAIGLELALMSAALLGAFA